MRLNKIKLAGFKSFVDPTAVNLPGNLTGVVGPNGCGKSNIIDAVRWVMGEISAKHLRGDSMADVVFNGSSSRKPVGTASVELVFDNSDGQLAGQYAGYAEVSLKRVVSRDGTSAYFLNGARCRRKDITQLFLGTGLGSRSYAIIEQGMISRVIEARPEELRGFIEEAAGISKYKERRRETESRISHTKENLDRLNDVRQEVEKQLRHLQRQAATARRYQALKQEERKVKAELVALRLRLIEEDAHLKQARLSECDTALQAALADLRSVEAAIEASREEFTEKSESLSTVQARFYQAGAEISRTEQALQHGRELRQRQKTDLDRAERGATEAQLHLTRDESQIAQLTAELAELEPTLAQVREREQASLATQEHVESSMHEWQLRWDEFNQRARSASEQTQVERARIEQLELQLQRLAAQRERLGNELGTLDTAQLEIQLARTEQQQAQTEAQHEEGDQQLQQAARQLQALRERETQLLRAVDASRQQVQQSNGQIVSLQALQRAALGMAKNQANAWLNQQQLADRPRLAQQLVVEPGWERAVETVLGPCREAVAVDTLESIGPSLATLAGGTLSFFDGTLSTESDSKAAAGRLLERVSGPAAVSSLLGEILAVDSLPEALQLRRTLQRGQSVITRDGLWVGPDWLRVSRGEDAHAGVLQREQEMRTAREAHSAAQGRLEALQEELAETRERITDQERERERLQGEANRLHRAGSELTAQLTALGSRIDAAAQRQRKIREELAAVEREEQSAQQTLATAQARLDTGAELTEQYDAVRIELEQQRDELRQSLGARRAQAQADRALAQDVAIKVESKRTALSSISAGLDRLQQQMRQLGQRRDELQGQLLHSEGPLAELSARLEELLAQRIEVERELSEARDVLADVEGRMRAYNERRAATETEVEKARSSLEEMRLAVQELKIHQQNLLEQFQATQFELADVYREMPAEAQVGSWEEQLQQLTQKIDRLGQVNLAAIDEFKEQSERKEYLDRQFKDLTEALETLEAAIRKIDRETRARFQDTFDRVNAGLKERFPRLFGGGHAYLELAGEDILSAGVSIMARPPGKRNSTINQLSGGEKALTAVALVFSIFELTPAPFCLLDEVDAPLDDNNVGRFCDTVREMSQRVQFIFITHNKTTMEMATQLIGVTMHEPGVSRLVAVDVEEAIRMAAM
jgi:chromosome segregation protein